MNSEIKKMLQEIIAKKEKLDFYRPFPAELVKHMQEWFKIELAYTSNALEGNTLSSVETALVIEKGLTIGGKTVKEHLEAINHGYAFDYILELAQGSKNDINLSNILNIHKLILNSIDNNNAGILRRILARIAGLELKLPDPLLVPELMEKFIMWLHKTDEHPVLIAGEAHLKLVTIHPFVDGNGRTARLLMNLLLIQQGYPPALILLKKRVCYINALKQAQEVDNKLPYYTLILQAVNRSLDIYLEHVQKTI